MAYQDPSDFDIWITDRIGFSVYPGKSGNTGDFDNWITDRLDFGEYQETLEAGLTVVLDTA